MKKLLLVLAAGALLASISCTKEYTCTCTKSDDADYSYTTTITNTKSNAEEACDALEIWSTEECEIE